MDSVQRIQEYIDERGWKYEQVRPGTVRLSWSSKPVDYDEVAVVTDLEELGERVTFSMSPELRIPNEKLWEVLDLINRHNRNIALGKWTIDFDDGKLYFQASIICSTAIETPLVKFLFGLTGYEHEQLIPGVMTVAFGGRNAAEVAQEIADS